MSEEKGRVSKIAGPVVDVSLTLDALPELNFALEHVAHLGDYIERESPLFFPLSTIKIALEKELKYEQERKNKA